MNTALHTSDRQTPSPQPYSGLWVGQLQSLPCLHALIWEKWPRGLQYNTHTTLHTPQTRSKHPTRTYKPAEKQKHTRTLGRYKIVHSSVKVRFEG